MNRFLQFLNLAGVVVLAALCCAQWRANRRANLQAINLEKTRLEQIAKIAEQDKTIAGYHADLDDFRQRLTLSEAALKESKDQFNRLADERDKLIAERDQLKTALDQWNAAVAQRDAALKQAGDEIRQLILQRDGAVKKFNDLAEKYNTMVKSADRSK